MLQVGSRSAWAKVPGNSSMHCWRRLFDVYQTARLKNSAIHLGFLGQTHSSWIVQRWYVHIFSYIFCMMTFFQLIWVSNGKRGDLRWSWQACCRLGVRHDGFMQAVAVEGLKKVAGYTCQDLANSAACHRFYCRQTSVQNAMERWYCLLSTEWILLFVHVCPWWGKVEKCG